MIQNKLLRKELGIEVSKIKYYPIKLYKWAFRNLYSSLATVGVIKQKKKK